MTAARAWGLAIVALVVIATTTPPRAARAERPAAVIPPGHEELFAAMLGRGAALPENCAFATGAIERSVVRGVYRCGAEEVVLELRDPAAAPPAAPRTDKIALVAVRGTPPAALLAALADRVREREHAFEWERPAPETGTTTYAPACGESAPLPAVLDPYFPGCYPRAVAVLLGIAEAVVMVLGLVDGLRRLGAARAPDAR